MLLNIDILEEFLRNYNSKLTGSFIATKKSLNQKTVSTYLVQLEKEGILKSYTQGRNRLYSLNLENKDIILEFINGVEHFRTINFFKKHIVIKGIINKLKAYVNGTGLIFGSYVKGKAKKQSDLDVFIVGKADEKSINKLSKVYRIEINTKIYPRFINDTITREVIKDHIAFKGVEQFTSDVYEANKMVYE